MGQTYAGRYELVDLIGRGGMGDVWRAWDRREKRFVAAKVLRQSDSAALLRFVRESSWRIDHPHVVMPTGWAGEDDLVLFAMPIVGGGSLSTVIKDHGRVPWSWARVVLDQVLQALDAVHAAGLVHRDVKPANILLQPTGTARPFAMLSDFGIAWHRDEPRLTRATEMVGTPGYQAPELAEGAEPEPSHDLYSVGLVARAMLGTFEPGTILDAMVSPDPSQRPTSAATVRETLARADLAVFTDEPVEVFNQLPDWPAGWSPAGPVSKAQPALLKPRPAKAERPTEANGEVDPDKSTVTSPTEPQTRAAPPPPPPPPSQISLASASERSDSEPATAIRKTGRRELAVAGVLAMCGVAFLVVAAVLVL